MAADTLRVTFGRRSWEFEPGSTVRIGRSRECEVLVTDPRVSREQLRIRYRDGWLVTDQRRHERIGPLAGRTTITLADGVTVDLEVDTPPPPRTVVTVGRARDNDLVLGDPRVSRHQARLDRLDGSWHVTDLGSHNRTLVNARPVHDRTRLRERDRLTFGGTEVVLRGDDFMPVRTAQATLSARHVGYRLPDGRQLLVEVDFDAGPGELVAVVGPSGAGKSTLLKVLTGRLRPTDGSVSYDDYDLHDEFPALRNRIGLVPQEDVVHAKLTGRRALSYAAALRLPDDSARPERDSRVDATLAELGMTEHAGIRIAKLSGGQRKRISVALELLTSPSLLLLDEPTSGLDPALDRQLMQTLRDIADGGRTVVVVTHNVANLGLCDKVLLLAPGGVPAFLGPSAEAFRQFGTDDWADILEEIKFTPFPVGAESASTPREKRDSETAEIAKPQLWRQARTVAARHLRLIAADPGYSLFLAVLPVVLALLALAVPGHAGLRNSSPVDATEASQILVLVFVGAAFMGGAAAAREVIGERAVLLRERAAGLRAGAYAIAKSGVFALVCALQTLVFVGVLVAVKPGPADGVVFAGPGFELGVAVWATATASCLLSQLGSALVRSSEQAMPVLVVTVMAQLVLCGGMIPVTGRVVLAQASWLVPARWGYAGGASTVDLVATGLPPDVLWTHAPGWWTLAMGVLLLQAIMFVLLLRARVKRLAAPSRRRTRSRG